MKGRVTEVGEDTGGRRVALVQLDGQDDPVRVPYWPELLQQWGPDRLRGWLVDQAQALVPAQAPAADAEDPHQALVGEADAAAVDHAALGLDTGADAPHPDHVQGAA